MVSEWVSERVTRTWPEHGMIPLNLERWNISSKPVDYRVFRFKRCLDRILTAGLSCSALSVRPTSQLSIQVTLHDLRWPVQLPRTERHRRTDSTARLTLRLAQFQICASTPNMLRLCILIAAYSLFCIFCFHRANWHSSATMTEDFPVLFPQL